MKILIVGNIVKDVYLRFDAAQNGFETDENGVAWMDVPFDGSPHNYFRRTSVFAGAAVTAEVLESLQIGATISGSMTPNEGDPDCVTVMGQKIEPSNKTYRYILCKDDQISYLAPTDRPDSVFEPGDGAVDWILVDRSAKLSKKLLDDMGEFLAKKTSVQVASFISTKGYANCPAIDMRQGMGVDANTRRLAEMSDLVFTDGDLFDLKPRAAVCRITDNTIEFQDERVHYKVESDDMLTHLTIYSVIAATVFGALVSGRETREALMMAAINARETKITGALTAEKLKEELRKMQEKQNDLQMIAKTLVARGKGILAADESGGSIHKKFEAAGIPDDEQHRRDYRNIFFTTEGLGKYTSGVILFDETARQKADDGRDFTTYLTSLGIIPGIKVDQGLEPFEDPKYAAEKWTKGLEGLPERLADYYEMGLRFAKWRAAFEVTIKDGEIVTPSDFAIGENAKILARYALDCQDAGIVPIVEPEVVHDGDYSIEVCRKLTGKILDALFKELRELGVDLAGCILKCNMVLAGKQYAEQSTPQEVGAATAETLREHVPAELAGVVFLSGGQSVVQATENLQEVTNHGPFPWPVTFSYARALQGPALDAWQGDNNNIEAARAAFYERLVANTGALEKK